MPDDVQLPLEELLPPNPYNKPTACLGCPLYEAPGPVWGFGDKKSKLILVGQAPGEHEAGPGGTKTCFRPSGRPFTGGSGRVLRSLMRDTNIPPTTYMTNVVKCRCVDPIDGKDKAPDKTAIDHCIHYLRDEVEQIKPNVVVALGSEALYAFKGRNEIGKFRGQAFIDERGQKCFSTYHPAALMRMQHMFPLVIEDLKRAKTESANPALHRVEVGYRTFNLGEGDLDALRRRTLEAGYLCEDLETSGLDGRYDYIKCCGFGTAPKQADTYVWGPDVAEFVRWAHSQPNLEIVGQNSESFDFVFLEDKGIPYPVGKRYDTLLGFHLINPDLPKDLGTQGSVYTDREYWKDKGRFAKSLQETMEYCCEDIDGTTRSYLTQKKELEYLGLLDLYYGSVMPLQPVLRRMTRRGVKKDIEKADLWSLAMNTRADELEETLRKGLGDPFFNVNSSKQVIDLLYNKLGLPPQYTRDKTRGSRLTGNAQAIEKLAEITDDPIFHLFNEIRSLRKWASTYCDVEVDDNNYMHPQFGSAKAANGRLNSWDPNAQNFPNDLREIIVADTEDHVFISADWSQVEWRNEMVLSGDELGLEMFAKGRDIHKTAATGFLGMRYEDVDKQTRHEMKFVVYGLLYGRSAKSVGIQIGKTEEEVEQMINGFFRVFKGVEAHMQLIQQQVSKQQYLRNPFARRRWWYSRMMTEVLNFLPSSTAADMMYVVLPPIERQLPAGATLRLTIHDEVVVCSPKDQKTLKQATECIKDNMQRRWENIEQASLYPERVKRFFPNGWTVPVDVSYGDNWKQCKPGTKEEEIWQKDFQKRLGMM